MALMLFFLVLIALAAALSTLLRRLGAPGGAILGGLIAGIILGPTLAGRFAPAWYEQTVIGGFAEREELDRLTITHGMNRAARQHFGLSTEQTAPLDVNERDLEMAQRDRVATARWEHQRPTRFLVAMFVGVLLVIAGLSREQSTGDRPDWYQPVVTGLWAAALPGAIGLLFLRWWGLEEGMCLAAGACLGTGALLIPRSDLEIADDAEPGGRRLMQSATGVAFAAAAIALSWGMVEDRGWAGLAGLWPIGLGVAAWVIGSRCPLPKTWADQGRWAAERLLTPALAAMIASRIELFQHTSIWIIVVLVLLSGDGRWTGAFIGAMLARARRALPTMRLVMASMAAGPTQVALTALALHLGLVNEPVGLALLISAAVMETTTPFRTAMARRVREAEDELDGAE